MTFAEKLDLLMRITRTTNSTLAFNVSLDPSFISRLRRGVRTPARNENYLKSISTYFAKHCNEDYQKIALSQALNISPENLASDIDIVIELIYLWLSDKKDDKGNSIEAFINNLSDFKFKKVPKAEDIPLPHLFENTFKDSVHYGIEGKQNAVISFLTLVLMDNKPQTLLLYSDEDIDWLIENREFTAKWSALLSRVIMKGNKIKIIHTVNRNLDEMLSAIEEWLPIYMTGAIEPYYYPKSRDGLFKRTLFVAPYTGAVASNSIGNKVKNGATFLYTGKDLVSSLTEEFNCFLSLCRPLMRIFNYTNTEYYLSTLSEFEAEEADSILNISTLSNVTMPMSVAESILKSMNNNKKEKILTYHEKRIIDFEKRLKSHSFTEVITLPHAEEVRKGKAKVSFSDMLDNTLLYYTTEEYIEHIQNIILLILNFDNYNIFIQSSPQPSDYMLYAKEDVGVIVAKTFLPTVAFAINESNMTAAFWDYLSSNLYRVSKNQPGKEHTIAMLRRFIENLRA